MGKKKFYTGPVNSNVKSQSVTSRSFTDPSSFTEGTITRIVQQGNGNVVPDTLYNINIARPFQNNINMKGGVRHNRTQGKDISLPLFRWMTGPTIAPAFNVPNGRVQTSNYDYLQDAFNSGILNFNGQRYQFGDMYNNKWNNQNPDDYLPLYTE